MRTLNKFLKVFVASAAVTMMVGCEEVDPPASPSPPHVAVAAPVTTPKLAEPIVKVEPVVAEVDDSALAPKQILDGARAALSRNELDRALTLARLATTKSPSRSAAWNTLGRVQLQKGRRKDAIASFGKAVELNPKSSFAQNNLGLALIYDRRYEDAVDALEEATGLEPAESYMFNNLGMAYEHLDRLEEARDAYRKSAELKNRRASENLARLEGVKSVMRTAKADAQKAEEIAAPDGGAEFH